MEYFLYGLSNGNTRTRFDFGDEERNETSQPKLTDWLTDSLDDWLTDWLTDSRTKRRTDEIQKQILLLIIISYIMITLRTGSSTVLP